MQYSIRELRARKKWTQAQTAKKIGVSVQTYNKWENNVDMLTVSKLEVIARVFGVEIKDIFLA